MAKKGVEYRVVWVQDRPESAQDELNLAARDGFKFAGTTANAVIMERKVKAKEGEDHDPGPAIEEDGV
ncbi:MAG TPA: hypothetical protein VJT33_11090 [bacterium]|nr:hypothetical protein [bacterium]